MVKGDGDGPAATVVTQEVQAHVTAGYGGSPPAKKLGLKKGLRVALAAPRDFRKSLELRGGSR